MPQATIFSGQIFEDSGGICLARLIDGNGDNLTQANTTSITYKVYDKSETEVATGTLTVADVIFDTLQTTLLWTRDDLGYNFKAELPATAFPSPNETYRAEFKVTPASGEVFFVKYKISTLGVSTS